MHTCKQYQTKFLFSNMKQKMKNMKNKNSKNAKNPAPKNSCSLSPLWNGPAENFFLFCLFCVCVCFSEKVLLNIINNNILKEHYKN